MNALAIVIDIVLILIYYFCCFYDCIHTIG